MSRIGGWQKYDHFGLCANTDAACSRFLLGHCLLNEKTLSFRDAKDVGPLCAPIIWIMRSIVGRVMLQREEQLDRPLSMRERDDFVQWVADASFGHNTPFQAAWNVRELSYLYAEVPLGKIGVNEDGDVTCGKDTLSLHVLR